MLLLCCLPLSDSLYGTLFRCILKLFPSTLHINSLSPFSFFKSLYCILGNFFILFFNTLNLFSVMLSLLIHTYIDSFYFGITLFIMSLCLIVCLVSWILILPLFLYFKINFYQTHEIMDQMNHFKGGIIL